MKQAFYLSGLLLIIALCSFDNKQQDSTLWYLTNAYSIYEVDTVNTCYKEFEITYQDSLTVIGKYSRGGQITLTDSTLTIHPPFQKRPWVEFYGSAKSKSKNPQYFILGSGNIEAIFYYKDRRDSIVFTSTEPSVREFWELLESGFPSDMPPVLPSGITAVKFEVDGMQTPIVDFPAGPNEGGKIDKGNLVIEWSPLESANHQYSYISIGLTHNPFSILSFKYIRTRTDSLPGRMEFFFDTLVCEKRRVLTLVN